jgi:DNA invertase Pin-like site-specific DNA recombinase
MTRRENPKLAWGKHPKTHYQKQHTMMIGYARVSTKDQELDLQLTALAQAGCEKIYEDRISGSKVSRPGLDQALEHCRAGDTLVVWKLDRAGRSIKNLIELTQGLVARDVGFRSLTDAIDTSTPSGRFFFHMMAALAEMERELIIERTRAGLAVAKARGKVGGRKPKLTKEQLKLLNDMAKNPNASVGTITKTFGISTSTYYRCLR